MGDRPESYGPDGHYSEELRKKFPPDAPEWSPEREADSPEYDPKTSNRYTKPGEETGWNTPTTRGANVDGNVEGLKANLQLVLDHLEDVMSNLIAAEEKAESAGGGLRMAIEGTSNPAIQECNMIVHEVIEGIRERKGHVEVASEHIRGYMSLL